MLMNSTGCKQNLMVSTKTYPFWEKNIEHWSKKMQFYSKIFIQLDCLLSALNTRVFSIYYHPRMRVGNVFGRVCLSVSLSVCLSVQTITFELLHIGTSFLVWRYTLTISRSSLSIKVIVSRSRSCAKKMIIYLFQLVIPLYVATGL